VLGLAWLRQGQAAAAEPLLRESVDTFCALSYVEPWRVARAQSAWGECLTALGRFAEAEPLLVESYETMLTEMGTAFCETPPALKRIVALYDAWGDPQKAAAWRERLSAEYHAASRP
jgi:hypothetical protein